MYARSRVSDEGRERVTCVSGTHLVLAGSCRGDFWGRVGASTEWLDLGTLWIDRNWRKPLG